jgi:hypothetical protein
MGAQHAGLDGQLVRHVAVDEGPDAGLALGVPVTGQALQRLRGEAAPVVVLLARGPHLALVGAAVLVVVVEVRLARLESPLLGQH